MSGNGGGGVKKGVGGGGGGGVGIFTLKSHCDCGMDRYKCGTRQRSGAMHCVGVARSMSNV